MTNTKIEKEVNDICIDGTKGSNNEKDNEKMVLGLEIESELEIEMKVEEDSHLSTTQDGFSGQKMVGHPHPEGSYISELSSMSDIECSKEEDQVIVNTLLSNQSM